MTLVVLKKVEGMMADRAKVRVFSKRSRRRSLKPVSLRQPEVSTCEGDEEDQVVPNEGELNLS